MLTKRPPGGGLSECTWTPLLFRGLVADVGSLARLPLILSDGHLRELALTGKDMPYFAARAVAFGMDHDEAIRALTINPANVFGVMLLGKDLGLHPIQAVQTCMRRAADWLITSEWRAEGLVGLIGSPLVAVVVWLSAGVLIWGVGVKRFHYSADYPELLRYIEASEAKRVYVTGQYADLLASRLGDVTSLGPQRQLNLF